MSSNLQKILRRCLKKKRGISPIIAEILLIGLTLLAGAITFTTVFVVMTTKEPIVVRVDSFSDFRLTGYSNSTKYNSFSFVLDNQGKRAVGVRAQDFKMWINGILNDSWSISRDYELGAFQSYSISVTTNNQSSWLAFNSSIKIQLTAYGLETSYDQADKQVIISSTTINSNLISTGPIQLKNSLESNGVRNYAYLQASNLANNTMNITVQNYGHLNTSYSLDFIVSSPNINLTLNYFGSTANLSTQIDGYLPAASGDSPFNSTLLIINASFVNKTSVVNTSNLKNNYFIIAWLKIDQSIQDTLLISCY